MKFQQPISLPRPDGDSLALSLELTTLIHKQIVEAGPLDFASYMAMALYEPSLGYYRNGLPIFGESGDFITAAHLGDHFAGCVARQCAEVLRVVDEPILMEFGAGDGSLAADILSALDRLDCLPDKYLIVETSPAMKDRQEKRFAGLSADIRGRIQWLQRLPETPINGVMLANEVLDALPFQRFIIDDDGQARLFGVDCQQEAFQGCTLDDTTLYADQCLERIQSLALPAGYISELMPQAEAWTKTLVNSLGCGMVLLIDYGFPQHEIYHCDRTAGSLMCHYKHHSHGDPFYYPGLQDITCHIDFTAIAQAGLDAGGDLAGFVTQSAFLLSLGILDSELINNGDNMADKENILAMQAIKKLLMPHEMGELFKVMGLTKGIDFQPSGFALRDMRHRLWR